ncbi:anti-sigma-K factor RskA [Xanthobacter flavus]|uniref:Anti-sigma-K factor RskA n=1 Tax=Xanthobacter flavus TaxID=281 RepID=A0A9W6CMA0_XANFL|nr:hypothetical protein [Xanthobacter flavus]MDR6334635.1 anti-sigma-K factor RskA [Xanthobacter flavus]GLI23344.1 hypothetical protein XFLAVUS301_30180 [Xanthobacter flavus]
MSPASPDRLPERVAPPDADRILAAEYVLGTLDNEDRRRVRARCAAEPQFAALVRLWERRLAPLHELAVPVIPSPDIWRAIASDLRSAPPALRGATLPRGMSPSPDPPRRPAMPEGRPLRSGTGAGEGAVSRVRRLFGLGRGAEPGRVEPSRGAERPSRRRSFPPLEAGPMGPSQSMDPGRAPVGAIRDARSPGLLSPVTSEMSHPALPRPENTPIAPRLPEPAAPLQLVPPPPRPRPAPEPLTPPPAFMFLEPDPPPEPEPVAEAPAPAGDSAPVETAPVAESVPLPAPVTEPAEATPLPETAGAVPEPPVMPETALALSGDVPDTAEPAPVAPVSPPPPVETEPAALEAAPPPVAEAVPEPVAVPTLPEPIPALTVPEAVEAPEQTPEEGAEAAAPAAVSADAPEASSPEAVPQEAAASEPPSADPAAGEKAEEAPLPGWAAEVASGEVSALPDEPNPPTRVVVRHGPWRGISLLLALLCLGLGGVAAYREWVWPGEGYWVAVMQAEPLPAVSVRIDPDSGAVHVRSFAPAPPEGETYRLWLVSPSASARLIGAFSSGLSERMPELARLGRKGLAGTELVVTREPADRPDTLKGPESTVVYRGRLVPE